MMNNLKEEDFYTFKMNITSGRQTAETLGGLLKLMLFCQIIPAVFAWFASEDAITFSSLQMGIKIFIIIIAILSIVFSVKFVYRKLPTAQYSIFFINIIEFSVFLIFLGAIGIFNETAWDTSLDTLRNSFTIITQLLGIVSFVVSLMIFRSHAKLGYYRKRGQGTKKMHKNEQWGKKLMSISLPLAIIAPMIMKRILPESKWSFIFMGIFFIVLGCIIYVGAAWTFMTLYCQIRFKGFGMKEEIKRKKVEK